MNPQMRHSLKSACCQCCSLAVLLAFMPALGTEPEQKILRWKLPTWPPEIPRQQCFAKVDELFKTLPGAPPHQRDEIITELHRILETTSSWDGDAVRYYGYDRDRMEGSGKRYKPNPDRIAVLGRAIPVMISMLDGEVRNKVYVILTSIQGDCPAPTREVWENWWKTTASEKFPTRPATPTN